MYEITQDIDKGHVYTEFHCPHCGSVIGGDEPTLRNMLEKGVGSCVYCYEYLPNIFALLDSSILRISFHAGRFTLGG